MIVLQVEQNGVGWTETAKIQAKPTGFSTLHRFLTPLVDGTSPVNGQPKGGPGQRKRAGGEDR